MLSPAASLLLLALVPSAPQEDPLAEARALLAAGRPQEAEALALRLLPAHPYDTGLYSVLLEAAKDLNDIEGQLRWGKWLYWAQDYGGREREARELAERLAAISPEWNLDGAILAAWRESIRKTAAKAMRERRYRVAGHLLGRLLDLDPQDEKLGREWEKLLDKAGSSALGGAFVADRVRRRSQAWVEKVNRRHREWKNAFRRKTAHYEIITNISFEFFETVSVVMEEMYDFYQDVYGYRKKAPRMTLAIHARRSDFDKYCIDVLGASGPLGLKGWFHREKLILATYDESEDGSDLSDLWNTLFHEASHEFMYLMCRKPTKQPPPAWLNEGTASYFEGCEVKADGSIVKNKPSLLRVWEWESIERSSRRHTLKELITQAPTRSYGGSFYSYGWALVYFLLNYEDEEGNLIYREPYLKYLRSYTRKGPKELRDQIQEGYRRAVKFFVEEVDDPEVPDWEAFEARWRRFTQQVVKETKAGPEFADVLQERVRRYLERGDWERARIAAEQADDKRPRDPETYRLLAEANLGARRKDDAWYWMLRHWELAWRDGNEELTAAAERWLEEQGGGSLVTGYCQANRTAAAAIEEAMAQAMDAGHPVLSLLFAAHAIQAFGQPQARLLEEVAYYRDLSGHDLRQWLRAFDKSPEANRQRWGVTVVQYEPDGVLVNTPEGAFDTRVRCDHPLLAHLRPPFAIRGTIVIDGLNGAQIVFGATPATLGQAAIGFNNGASATFFRIDRVMDEEHSGMRAWKWKDLEAIKLPPAQKLHFVLEVDATGQGVLMVNEKHRGETPEEWTAERLTGGFALETGDDTVALFQNLEVRPERPFWPVAPGDGDDD